MSKSSLKKVEKKSSKKKIRKPTFRAFRPWFLAAALYNFFWGILVVVQPYFLFDVYDIPRPGDVSLWQVVGMFLLVYAPAYFWAARHPYRFRHFILIGLLGKLLGPLGFVYSYVAGHLPLAFGWILLTNDLIWWPAFGLFIWRAVKRNGGWWKFLTGEKK